MIKSDIEHDNIEAPLSFEEQWSAILLQIRIICFRALLDHDLAEDVTQQIAIRAWRGYPTFNHQSSFFTWVYAIARRELARAYTRRRVRNQREQSLDDPDLDGHVKDPAFIAPEIPNDGPDWLPRMIEAAYAAGEITSQESMVVSYRLAHGDKSWIQIGRDLNIEGNACAVLHCRTIPKLRVYLFTHHIELIGGMAAVLRAFEAAESDRIHGLSPEESVTFRYIVLQRNMNYRRLGWRNSLRSACHKVIHHLTIP